MASAALGGEPAASAAAGLPDRNEVLLTGRLPADAVERILPSGNRIVSFRLVVRRPADSGPEVGRAARSARATVDTVDCTAWSGSARRTVAAWRGGDVVEVTGALRRRFWRTPGGPASRYDVEVTRARRLRRSPP